MTSADAAVAFQKLFWGAILYVDCLTFLNVVLLHKST